MRHRIVCPSGVYDFVFKTDMEFIGPGLRFSHTDEAMEFLRPFMTDGGNMAAFRAVLGADQSLHGAASWESDAEVVRQLSWRLVQGRVFLVKAAWQEKPRVRVRVTFTQGG